MNKLLKRKQPDSIIRTPFSEIKLFVRYEEDPVKFQQFPEDLLRVLHYIAKQGGWESELEELQQSKKCLEELMEDKRGKSL